MPDETRTIVTARPEVVTDRQQAAITIVTMPWWKIVLVRGCRVYVQSLLGFLTSVGTGIAGAVADAIGTPIPVMDFWHALVFSASLAVAPTAISLLQNIAELLAKIDATSPQMRG